MKLSSYKSHKEPDTAGKLMTLLYSHKGNSRRMYFQVREASCFLDSKKCRLSSWTGIHSKALRKESKYSFHKGKIQVRILSRTIKSEDKSTG